VQYYCYYYYYLLNTQKKAAWRTHNIKKHTTHEKEKRETFPQKKAPTQNTKSLSLSLSPFRSSFSLGVSRFLSKNLDENGRVAAKKRKISLLLSSQCFLLCCEPRYRENSCLRLLSRERTLSPPEKNENPTTKAYQYHR
jgi:hypothetical protein